MLSKVVRTKAESSMNIDTCSDDDSSTPYLQADRYITANPRCVVRLTRTQLSLSNIQHYFLRIALQITGKQTFRDMTEMGSRDTAGRTRSQTAVSS